MLVEIMNCVTMQQLNVVIRDSCRGGWGGALGYPPKPKSLPPPPLIFFRIIIKCQIQDFKIALVESKFVSKKLTSKIIILQDMPPN